MQAITGWYIARLIKYLPLIKSQIAHEHEHMEHIYVSMSYQPRRAMSRVCNCVSDQAVQQNMWTALFFLSLVSFRFKMVNATSDANSSTKFVLKRFSAFFQLLKANLPLAEWKWCALRVLLYHKSSSNSILHAHTHTRMCVFV